MSDEHGVPDETTRAAAARAAAASRARRIGGRTVRPGTSATPPATPPVTPAAPPIPTPGGTVAEPPASAPAAPATGPEPHEHDEASTGTGSALAWLPALLLGAAALVFAILIAIDASSGSGSGSSAAGNRLREQVLAAAKQCAAQANTYDYRSLDASEAKAAACTTGVYHTENQSTFEKVIKKYAPKLHATQSAQIDTAGIENISEDGKTWTVLLFGQLVQTNNTTAKQGRYDPQAIEVVMTNVGGKWLVSALNGA